MAKGLKTLSQFSNIYFYVRNANNLRFVLAKLKSHTEAGNLLPEESKLGVRRFAQECIKFKYYDHTPAAGFSGFTRLLTVETMLSTHGDPPISGPSIN